MGDKNNDLTERTTVYLNENVKADSRVKLIRQNQTSGENKSLSALINELLKEWLQQS